VSLVLIATVAWVALAVFVCSLGRAAKTADRRELAGLALADTIWPPGHYRTPGRTGTGLPAERLG
jgi:hypothetical protein